MTVFAASVNIAALRAQLDERLPLDDAAEQLVHSQLLGTHRTPAAAVLETLDTVAFWINSAEKANSDDADVVEVLKMLTVQAHDTLLAMLTEHRLAP